MSAATTVTSIAVIICTENDMHRLARNRACEAYGDQTRENISGDLNVARKLCKLGTNLRNLLGRPVDLSESFDKLFGLADADAVNLEFAVLEVVRDLDRKTE
jgi:hypothetical protein